MCAGTFASGKGRTSVMSDVMTGAISAFVRHKTIVVTYRQAGACPTPMTASLRRRFTVERLQCNRFAISDTESPCCFKSITSSGVVGAPDRES